MTENFFPQRPAFRQANLVKGSKITGSFEMTYATRTSYSSPSPPLPHKNSQDGAGSTLARAPTQCTRGNRWLMASPGSRSFFHKPRVNPPPPPTSRLFYIVPRFQRLIFPHCAVAHLSPPTVPLSTTQFSLSLSRVPSFPVSFRLTCRWQAFSTAFSSPPTYHGLRLSTAAQSALSLANKSQW